MDRDALGPLAPVELVRDRAVDALRDAIVSGRLAPGTRLIERELCEALGVSRPSVREAVRRLEAEHLIETGPRRGPVVTALSRDTAREIYEIRRMIESLLIRRFTRRATEDEVEALHAAFRAVEGAAEAGDIGAVARLMRGFNAVLAGGAGHGTARDLLEGLDARISVLRVRAMTQPGRLARSLVEYRAILAAVRARDADGAARLIERSVDAACAAALDQLAAGAAT